MINILKSGLPVSELERVLAGTAGATLLPPLGDPAWAAARVTPATAAWLPALTQRALDEAGTPLPPLTEELYGDFFKTGRRHLFERVYFARRRSLGQTAIAILLGDASVRERLTGAFLRRFTDILDEDSWTLPAHVWEKPDGKDPMHIDLFAAETANNLAEMWSVFAEIIPAALGQRLRARLRKNIFENYARREPPFHWTTLPMNWNAVCHQGVIGAALAIEQDHALVAGMLARAAAALPAYLDGLGDDGSSSEGPGYWSYGFGWFSELNAQLERRTRGELSLIEGDGKIARVARFGPQLVLANGYLVNFADGPRKARLNPALLAYLGERLDDDLVRAQAEENYAHQSVDGIDLDGARCDFFHLTRLALRAPQTVDGPVSAPLLPDVWFPDYGAVVSRGRDRDGHLWEFAAKAGHNDEHHNHNDCGSFILHIDGAPVFIEIGAPEYNRAFFSAEERYTFLAARSLGHSVPWVNGREQAAGREFAARVIRAECAPDKTLFEADLAACYPPGAKCQSLRRSCVLDKTAGSLRITDAFEFEEPGSMESVFITELPLEQIGNTAQMKLGPARVCLAPAEGARIQAIETCSYRNHASEDATVYRLRLVPTRTPASQGALSLTITLA